MLTILFNGSTCRWIISVIGLDRLTKNQIENNLDIATQINDVLLEFVKDDKIPMLSKLLFNKINIYDFMKSDYLKARNELDALSAEYDFKREELK